jgi:serine/threonine protein kinase
MFAREIEGLIHPCYVAVVGYSLATWNSLGQIGTRCAANGSVQDALAKSAGFLDDTDKAIVVIGMKFFHSQGVAHRGLKPENILLDERGFTQLGDLRSSQFCDAGLTLTA